MIGRRGAIFFDADGVLIDSLPAHLRICRDKAEEFGLSIAIPSVAEFRRLVNRGAKISPMRFFFAAVGIPENLLDRAVRDYEHDFAERYRPALFRACETVLAALRRDGWTLGLVTSNTSANVLPILGDSVAHFDPDCIFTLDRFSHHPPKAWCLQEGARLLDLVPEDCFYVGDLPSDGAAAAEARFRFLGVTYGWGLERADQRFETVDDLTDIPEYMKSSIIMT
ncbi:HAD family hydrolase [Beijerinckia sp. L45]|uniref:HAD family hydrolase n=1 Tax=Beijerinckia sp. L45 TaxID=1641855 RepID=UPI00131CF439|nr:HAD hydrolase-like protein [Beijerinckia sp. L45]